MRRLRADHGAARATEGDPVKKRLRAGNIGKEGACLSLCKGHTEISKAQAIALVGAGLIYSAGKGYFKPTTGTKDSQIEKQLERATT